MTDDLHALVDQLRCLERDIERKLDERRKALNVHISDGRLVFEKNMLAQHLALRTGLARFLFSSPLKFYLTVPVIYALILPIALMDICVTIFQAVCFRAWGLTRVRRSDYLAFDRRHLAYLNGIQKLNCTYCSYANGVIAYVREVAARTEQFWCPIKHALRVRGTHERYRDFLDFGDAEGFVRKSEQYRRQLRATEIPTALRSESHGT